jgi:hypothetical protein
MKREQITYRVGQFRKAVGAAPNPADLTLAQTYLDPAQMDLFLRMRPGEQAHSLRVLKHLIYEPRTDEDNHDLLVAALLHDVGKSRYPLSLWERVFIVLMKSLLPEQFRRWGVESATKDGRLDGLDWHRPFVIAEQHPRWGAEMASAAGASPLTTSLILRHQDIIDSDPLTLEDSLLKRLQAADSAC